MAKNTLTPMQQRERTIERIDELLELINRDDVQQKFVLRTKENTLAQYMQALRNIRSYLNNLSELTLQQKKECLFFYDCINHMSDAAATSPFSDRYFSDINAYIQALPTHIISANHDSNMELILQYIIYLCDAFEIELFGGYFENFVALAAIAATISLFITIGFFIPSGILPALCLVIGICITAFPVFLLFAVINTFIAFAFMCLHFSLTALPKMLYSHSSLFIEKNMLISNINRIIAEPDVAEAVAPVNHQQQLASPLGPANLCQLGVFTSNLEIKHPVTKSARNTIPSKIVDSCGSEGKLVASL